MTRSTPYLRETAAGTYYLHWTEDRVGKRISLRTKDKSKAHRALAVWLLRKNPLSPDSFPPDEESPPSAEITLEDAWRIYFDQHVRPREIGQYNAELAWKLLRRVFGKTAADELTQDLVDDYVAKRTDGRLGRKVKPQTAGKEVSYLRAAVKFCATDRIHLVSPDIAARKLEMPEPGEPRDRWLTLTEVQSLLDAAARLRRGPRLSRGERFIWLALETAGRAQALLDLMWDRVDFEINVIHLDVPGRKKTKKSRATVPISKALRPILERAYAERFVTSKKFGDREMTHVLDNGARIWAQIQLIAIEAGLGGKRPKYLRKEKPKATGISPHVLRHTAASNMARHGVPLWIIAKILGNSVRMVEKVYAKHDVDDLRDAIEQISAGRLSAGDETKGP